MSQHQLDKKSSRTKDGESAKRVSSQPLRDSKEKEERKVAKNWVDQDKMSKEILENNAHSVGSPISKRIADYLPKINPNTNKPDESNFAEEINAQQANLQSLVAELQESGSFRYFFLSEMCSLKF